MDTPLPLKSDVTRLRPRGRRRDANDSHGIVVREEPLTSIRVRLVYQMRCECGRAWFAAELPKLGECPACHQRGLIEL